MRSSAIWENGKKLSGEVRSRDEARRIYDAIVRRQRDPGLLEYAGKDLFQASIFPIPPNSDKKLELTYTQILKSDGGTVSYRYPLGTGHSVFNQPGQIAESGRRGRGQVFGIVSGKVSIKSNSTITNIYSPTHNLDVNRNGPSSAKLSFEANNNDNDLQIFYSLSKADLGMSLITFREPGKDGYFLMLVSPNDLTAESETNSKDIVFVLDTSGSMADEGKIDKARAALRFGVQNLRAGDRFNVINFAGEEHLMERGLVYAGDAEKDRAVKFIGNLRPTGGTNINDALVAAAKQFGKDDRPKMLVFITDGLPTVGETNIATINANLKAASSSKFRIFPFGLGYDVNTELLDRLGSENSGVSEYVQPKEDLEVKVSNFFAKVSSPVLSDIAVDMGGVETEFVYPRKLTDVFRGMQLAVLGRYKNDNDLKNVTIGLTGQSGDSRRSFTYPHQSFPARSTDNDFLPRLWASRRVGFLIEQIRLNGETKELRDEVTDLGTKYGIVTPYTSYLAIDGASGSDNTFMVDGQASSGGGNRPSPKAARQMMEMRSGAGAVQLSTQQNRLKSNNSLIADKDGKDSKEDLLVANSATKRFVGNKTFNNENGVWIDTEFAAAAKLPEIIVKFGSDEYYDLAVKDPELARYLSLGNKVVVVWKGKIYRVN